MKTIYLGYDFKCHTSEGEGVRVVETDVFDGKCDAYIEGCRFVPSGESWTRSDGVVFHGEMIAPWKPYVELDAAQREYERQLLAQYKADLMELDAALLEVQYQNLIGGL